MPAVRNILAVVLLLTAISSIGFKPAEAEAPDAASTETPSGVVARWLQHHRIGDRGPNHWFPNPLRGRLAPLET